MFDRVGNVDFLAVDAGLDQGAVEHLPRRSHERLSGQVLLVAGLLADQERLRIGWTFSEYGLGRVLPERAGTAMRGLFAQGFKAGRGCHGYLRFFRKRTESVMQVG